MRRALVLMVVLAGCKTKVAMPAYPVLVIDDAHLTLQHADGSKPVDYTVPPGPGVILDASSYTFRIPAQIGVSAPDTVNIVIGKGLMYVAEWKPVDGRVVLDATTLKPVAKNAPPFTSFPPGTAIALGVGHTVVENDQSKFSVIWVGMADVR